MALNQNATDTKSDQICFINYTQKYCVCIVDIVNSIISFFKWYPALSENQGL